MSFVLRESHIAFGHPEFWDAPVLKTVPQKRFPFATEFVPVDGDGDGDGDGVLPAAIEPLTGVVVVESL